MLAPPTRKNDAHIYAIKIGIDMIITLIISSDSRKNYYQIPDSRNKNRSFTDYGMVTIPGFSEKIMPIPGFSSQKWPILGIPESPYPPPHTRETLTLACNRSPFKYCIFIHSFVPTRCYSNTVCIRRD